MGVTKQARFRRWVRRVSVALLTFAAVLIVSAFTLSWIEGERNSVEESAVYSAYLSDGILHDPHDWSVGPTIQVVVEDTTSVGESLRWPILFAFDSRIGFPELTLTTHADFVVRNLLRTRLQEKIRLPSRATLTLASAPDISSPGFQQRFPNNMAYIVVSGVGFNPSQTQAVFYIDHFCGLCGGGRYVLMDWVKGVWQVQGEHHTWIS
jgi:hypothetical protein